MKKENPRFRQYDPELFPDYLNALTDMVVAIERDVNALKQSPDSRDAITSLFRSMHNLKGDSSICHIELGVLIAHPIESILSRVRDHGLPFTPLLGEAILVAIDRLEQAMEALRDHRSMSALNLEALIHALEQLTQVDAARIEEHAAALLKTMSGVTALPEHAEVTVDFRHETPQHAEATQTQRDLQFFQILAHQLETHSEHLRGRTARQLALALETNAEAGYPVNSEQLTAAVYLHDLGMMFLPEHLWLKPGNLSDEARQMMNRHPLWAAGLLQRMNGWAEAAQMVLQHHEQPKGGYPTSLDLDQVCAGAKILALVDAFEAINFKHQHRGSAISALRAIAEINACESQFAPEFIGPFNRVIRRRMQEAANASAPSH